MPIFYFNIDGPKGDKIVSLMANLSENFGVIVKDALMVETDIDFLVPMLERLEDSQVDEPKQSEPTIVAVTGNTTGAVEGKLCPECGSVFIGKSKFCSQKCYNTDYRARNKSAKNPSRKGALPNQAQVDQNLTEEQKRIEAVVAKAKMNAPSATGQHITHNGGAIMARKL